jgi:hypothetical protein
VFGFRSRFAQLGRVSGVVACSTLIAGLSILGARGALAFAPIPETGTPGYLTLATRPGHLHFPNLSPGSVAYGHIRVAIEEATTAELSLQAYGSGGLFEHPNGATLITRECSVEWTGVPDGVSVGAQPVCATGDRVVTSVREPINMTDAAPLSSLGLLEAGAARHLLVEVRMPPEDAGNDNSLMGLSGDFALRVYAQGVASPSTLAEPGGSPTQLATTGVDVLGISLSAIGAIMLGYLARRRRPHSETE